MKLLHTVRESNPCPCEVLETCCFLKLRCVYSPPLVRFQHTHFFLRYWLDLNQHKSFCRARPCQSDTVPNVGIARFELATFWISVKCSNQLSYIPMCACRRTRTSELKRELIYSQLQLPLCDTGVLCGENRTRTDIPGFSVQCELTICAISPMYTLKDLNLRPFACKANALNQLS